MIGRRSPISGRFIFVLLAGLCALLSILATALPASAQEPGQTNGSADRLMVNSRFVLHKGETHDGDLTVLAREVVLEPGSRVTGDLSVVSAGMATLNGEIDGNVSILAPSAYLGSSAKINGNFSVCSRDVTIGSGAAISGNQSTGCNRLGEVFSGVRNSAGDLSPIGASVIGKYNTNPLLRLLRVIFTSLGMGALGALAAAVFPRQINRLTGTALTQSMTMTIVGFLSMGVVLAITAIYALSIPVTLGLTCLALPIIGLVWLVVFIALLTGWIAISVPLGNMLLRRIHAYPTPMVAAAVGAMALTLVQGLFEMIPCIAWLSWLALIVLGSAGFGAVLLTRFGTRPYPEMIPARPQIL